MQNSILAEYAARNRSIEIRKKRQDMKRILTGQMDLGRRSGRRQQKRIRRR